MIVLSPSSFASNPNSKTAVQKALAETSHVPENDINVSSVRMKPGHTTANGTVGEVEMEYIMIAESPSAANLAANAINQADLNATSIKVDVHLIGGNFIYLIQVTKMTASVSVQPSTTRAVTTARTTTQPAALQSAQAAPIKGRTLHVMNGGLMMHTIPSSPGSTHNTGSEGMGKGGTVQANGKAKLNLEGASSNKDMKIPPFAGNSWKRKLSPAAESMSIFASKGSTQAVKKTTEKKEPQQQIAPQGIDSSSALFHLMHKHKKAS